MTFVALPKPSSGSMDRGLEWFAALAMGWWGLVLGFGGDLFNTTLFAGFQNLGIPQRSWAVCFGLVAGIRLATLWINGRWPRSPWVRMIGAAIGLFVFGQIAALFYEGSLITKGPTQTGVGIYALIAFAELYSILRAAHDVRYYSQR